MPAETWTGEMIIRWRIGQLPSDVILLLRQNTVVELPLLSALVSLRQIILRQRRPAGVVLMTPHSLFAVVMVFEAVLTGNPEDQQLPRSVSCEVLASLLQLPRRTAAEQDRSEESRDYSAKSRKPLHARVSSRQPI